MDLARWFALCYYFSQLITGGLVIGKVRRTKIYFEIVAAIQIDTTAPTTAFRVF
jgi:hypothetical protein